jgi:phosphate transport system protein
MSRHLQDLLDELKARVARMGAMVQQVVEQAVEAVFTADARLAQRTIDADNKIDDEEVRVEKAAIDLLALYQPAAGDLRLVTTVIKVNSELERIADCAVNAAQRVLPLSNGSGGGAASGGASGAKSGNGGGTHRYEAPADLKLMCNSVVSTLRDTIKAFNQGDADLARHVLRGDDVVDALYHQIVQDMLAQVEADGHKAAAILAYIMIAKNLERIADHCTNIAEDVIYVHTGRIIRHLRGT